MVARRLILTAGISVLFVLLAGGSALAAGAEDFIRVTGKRALQSLTDADVSEEVRAQRFRQILSETFDMPTIARFVLGRYWRVASKKQRTEYLDLFEDFLVQAYASQFKGMSGDQLQMGRTRDINARDKLVLTEVHMPKGKPVRIHWRVRGPESKFRIIDVMVEGISMSVTQRDEFAAVIRNHGGKVEGLLSALRKKTGRDD